MNITELINGEQLDITAKMGKNSISFKTNVVAPYKEMLLVSEIKDTKNRPISFFSTNVYLTVSCIRNNQKIPIIWENVVIKHLIIKGNPYHCIIQRKTGESKNRRNAQRVFIGTNIQCQVGLNRRVIKAVLKDVSTTGFAIITSENLDVGPGNDIKIVCTIGSFKFNETGYPIRKTPIPNTKNFLYGCKLKTKSKNIAEYIDTVNNMR